jgi:hypothetical protein
MVERVEAWQQERTSSCRRFTNKRRHHCRARGVERERYSAAISKRPPLTTGWEAGVWRKQCFDDVQLPAPPAFNSELLRTRRLLLGKRNLPRGCRVQPARNAKRRRMSPVDERHPQHVVQSPQPPTLDIVLTISDDEL